MKRSPAHRLAAQDDVDEFAYVSSDPFVVPKKRPLFVSLADSPCRAVPYDQHIYRLFPWQGDFINVTLTSPILIRRRIYTARDYKHDPFYAALDHAVDLWIEKKLNDE